MKALPKVLDLGMSNRGGLTGIYARNIIRDGDWATIAHIVGELKQNEEIHVKMCKEFNKPELLAKVKDWLRSIDENVIFADEAKTVTVEAVLNEIEKNHKLMSFEKNLVLNNPEKLHALMLDVKKEKTDLLPRQYDYELNNSNYPIIHVWSALNTMINN